MAVRPSDLLCLDVGKLRDLQRHMGHTFALFAWTPWELSRGAFFIPGGGYEPPKRRA
jgi:hypothetical protein